MFPDTTVAAEDHERCCAGQVAGDQVAQVREAVLESLEGTVVQLLAATGRARRPGGLHLADPQPGEEVHLDAVGLLHADLALRNCRL